ncbi:MAG: glucose-6-phosphate isomerase [Planctomycetota bacterium]|nr:glucose-6-phosphate isomerase [Planctomycetota bacterium]
MLELDFNNILSAVLGPGHSISESELNSAIAKHSHICSEILLERKDGKHPFLNLPYQNIKDIITFSRQRAKRYDDFVVLGIGGSALGTSTLLSALNPPFYNLLSARQRNGYPRLFVLDNIDSAETQALFSLISPKKTLFNVISKSGQTTETIADLLLALRFLKRHLKKRYRDNLVITTDKHKGFLRDFVRKEGIRSFETPPDVEGRYSVLSTVGLLPSAFVGIDIKKLLHGASLVDKYIKRTPPENNGCFLSALINYIYDQKMGKNTIVIMPYSSQLKPFAEWLRQLYPESLGKRYDRDNKEVYTGPTVLNALGVTDQHSQIQLFNEGPNNKLIIFIEVKTSKDKVVIPAILKDDQSASFIAGQSLHKLMLAEKRGTEYALVKSHRPNYTIRLNTISEETIGALLYFWELNTAYAGKLYNINPYNQPGVEAGKRATFGLLGRKEYQKEVADVKETLTKDKRWILTV